MKTNQLVLYKERMLLVLRSTQNTHNLHGQNVDFLMIKLMVCEVTTGLWRAKYQSALLLSPVFEKQETDTENNSTYF
jgi:hypothetical protein